MKQKIYKFRCIEDVIMNPTGFRACVKGKTYFGIKSSDGYFHIKSEGMIGFSHGAPINFLERYFNTPLFFKYGK